MKKTKFKRISKNKSYIVIFNVADDDYTVDMKKIDDLFNYDKIKYDEKILSNLEKKIRNELNYGYLENLDYDDLSFLDLDDKN